MMHGNPNIKNKYSVLSAVVYFILKYYRARIYVKTSEEHTLVFRLKHQIKHV